MDQPPRPPPKDSDDDPSSFATAGPPSDRGYGYPLYMLPAAGNNTLAPTTAAAHGPVTPNSTQTTVSTPSAPFVEVETIPIPMPTPSAIPLISPSVGFPANNGRTDAIPESPYYPQQFPAHSPLLMPTPTPVSPAFPLSPTNAPPSPSAPYPPTPSVAGPSPVAMPAPVPMSSATSPPPSPMQMPTPTVSANRPSTAHLSFHRPSIASQGAASSTNTPNENLTSAEVIPIQVVGSTDQLNPNEPPSPTALQHAKSNDELRTQAAVNEHARVDYPMSMSEHELGARFGVGVELYFAFIRFTVVANVVLALLSLVVYLPKLTIDQHKWDGFGTLFSISFTRTITDFWKTANILQIIGSFIIPGVYWLHQGRMLAQARNEGRIKRHEGKFFVTADNVIRENVGVPWHELLWRRSLSFLLYVGLTALVYFGTAGLQSYSVNSQQSRMDEDGPDFVALTDWGISTLLTLINMLSMFICYRLTDFERYRFRERAWQISIAKAFLFRGVTTVAFFQAIYTSDPCAGGVKFFTLLITDLLIGNIFEQALPRFIAKVKSPWSNINALGDEENRPEFDIAAEYVELLYRQYLIYQGSALYPGLALLGAVSNVAEYFLDKYRMLRHSRRPTIVNRPIQDQLTIVLVVVA
ncbi:hypothetical protein BCR44DRAFT_1483156, partial [Catenaria anguillulae PL171]